MQKLHPLVKEVLFTRDQIQKRTKEIAKEVESYYKDKPLKDNSLLVVGLLKGCVPFYTDFCMVCDLTMEMDFMVVSSYHGSTSSNSAPKINLDLNTDVKDRDILIIEDIIDTGFTLKYVKEYLLNKGAKSVKILTMLDKPSGRKIDLTADWVCFTIDPCFVIGYGLDYQEKIRNLPYVAVCDTTKLDDWKW
ncbi:hypoxanthine phosphoribosyltransferase [Mycoplasma leachii PG50]|uniref:Hypoxanthine phosphoribosyltransferase n=2 Tax=Mycoplasma leachii TaxID=2105 RepID=E4PTN5_MYCLG|nr:hypoxanthine phosphoribosyltransferase [Mycoplasma leachii]ADR24411.1 hypoxanthine phosphoribosyltransferase [Mycoplasma leachii PG50]PTD31149.1 Hypoxanthine phosphoribosyltransferase [Mycoplasma leachii 06049]CBV67197.1 Hypoxanthine phosphoribosyltransferase [Mycoplasma leachii 99/014/6]